jgi:hypothetical protein
MSVSLFNCRLIQSAGDRPFFFPHISLHDQLGGGDREKQENWRIQCWAKGQGDSVCATLPVGLAA